MNLDIKLLPWQQQVWNDQSRFKVVAAGRRTGKSRLAAWMLIVEALQADRGNVWYVAPTQGQARDIMWLTLLELGNPVIESSHVNNMQIKLVNGAVISLKGADRPETMRGVSLKFVVLDEYADMKPSVFEQTFLDNVVVNKPKMIILSWAVPGQVGDGHVNCQPNKYIEEQMKLRGYEHNKQVTFMLRKHSSLWWFKKTIMVFE